MPDRQLASSLEARGKKLEARAQPRASGLQLPDGFISLPDSFFAEVMLRTRDLAELKTVLCVCYLVSHKQDHPAASHHSDPERSEGHRAGPAQSKPLQESCDAHRRSQFVTYKELKVESCRLSAELDNETLRQALKSAVEHGALLHSTLNIDGVLEDVYSLAVPMYRDQHPSAVNIFSLYEQNIGMITPMIAEELKDATKLYPPQWITEAFKEAVTLNKRSWKYIVRILERWASEGKDSGEYKRDVKKDGPDKYVKGRYGHLVKR